MGPQSLPNLQPVVLSAVEDRRHIRHVQVQTSTTNSPFSPLSPLSKFPLFTSPSPPSSRRSPEVSSSVYARISRHLGEVVATKHTDLLLLLCCFISGLLDTGTFNAWSCFVNMQTGNTIFLALGASSQPANKPYGWLRSLIAIVFFIFGCFLFGLSERTGSQTRGVLFASFLMQDICLAIAATLAQTNVIPEGADSMKILIPIALVGFQAGGQVVASNLLGFKALPTTVLTSVYSGLATDKDLTAGLKENLKRNRRVAAVVLLGLGAIAGGWLTKDNRAGLVIILWLATGLKFFIASCLLCWKEDNSSL